MNNKKIILMGGTALFSTLAMAAPDMNEGLWEITSKMEATGMPFQMPTTTFTQCITKESSVPKTGEQGGGCRMIDVKTRGNTVLWSVQCNQDGQSSEGHGEVTYTGDAMNGYFKFTSNSPGGAMEITNTMSGRRLGPCR